MQLCIILLIAFQWKVIIFRTTVSVQAWSAIIIVFLSCWLATFDSVHYQNRLRLVWITILHLTPQLDAKSLFTRIECYLPIDHSTLYPLITSSKKDFSFVLMLQISVWLQIEFIVQFKLRLLSNFELSIFMLRNMCMAPAIFKLGFKGKYCSFLNGIATKVLFKKPRMLHCHFLIETRNSKRFCYFEYVGSNGSVTLH